jgi:hypothetical protein
MGRVARREPKLGKEMAAVTVRMSDSVGAAVGHP